MKTLRKFGFVSLILLIAHCNAQSDKLIGKWTNCLSVCYDVATTTNICAKIEFKTDLTVVITYAGAIENLKWKVDGNEITFSNLENEKSVTFSEDKIYILEFTSTTKLLIRERDRKQCYSVLQK